MPDRFDYARRLLERAEECRAIAQLIDEPALHQAYLKLADSYLAVARDEEIVSRAAELLRNSVADTFLGRKTQEPFPKENDD
jgi:hypothetical protein